MKLAEALAIRKDTQKKIEQLGTRLENNVKVQEGNDPAEDPSELMSQLDACLDRLQKLIFLINKTNMHTLVEGKTLTELMAEKDALTLRVSILHNVFKQATESLERYSRSEIKYVNTVDVRAVGKQIDTYSKQLRELEIKIQAANFSTELAD